MVKCKKSCIAMEQIKMKKQTAVNHFGTESKIALALGIKPQAVYQWGDYIPKGRAFEIQALTGGKLKYEPNPLKQAS